MLSILALQAFGSRLSAFIFEVVSHALDEVDRIPSILIDELDEVGHVVFVASILRVSLAACEKQQPSEDDNVHVHVVFVIASKD